MAGFLFAGKFVEQAQNQLLQAKATIELFKKRRENPMASMAALKAAQAQQQSQLAAATAAASAAATAPAPTAPTAIQAPPTAPLATQASAPAAAPAPTVAVAAVQSAATDAPPEYETVAVSYDPTAVDPGAIDRINRLQVPEAVRAKILKNYQMTGVLPEIITREKRKPAAAAQAPADPLDFEKY